MLAFLNSCFMTCGTAHWPEPLCTNGCLTALFQRHTAENFLWSPAAWALVLNVVSLFSQALACHGIRFEDKGVFNLASRARLRKIVLRIWLFAISAKLAEDLGDYHVIKFLSEEWKAKYCFWPFFAAILSSSFFFSSSRAFIFASYSSARVFHSFLLFSSPSSIGWISSWKRENS